MDKSIITNISLNKKYIDLSKKVFKYSYNMLLQDYKPRRKKVFYISPANSLGFMDGGIDKALSRVMFSGIEKIVKYQIRKFGKKNILNQKYLPIGSSIIIKPLKTDTVAHLQNHECYMVVAPTMLLPQPVTDTKNCYYATMAALYNIFVNGKHRDCEVVFTSMCCGYGYMDEKESLNQFIQGVKDFQTYKPEILNNKCIINEPNLKNQPKYYENTAFIKFPITEIVNKPKSIMKDEDKNINK